MNKLGFWTHQASRKPNLAKPMINTIQIKGLWIHFRTNPCQTRSVQKNENLQIKGNQKPRNIKLKWMPFKKWNSWYLMSTISSFKCKTYIDLVTNIAPKLRFNAIIHCFILKNKSFIILVCKKFYQIFCFFRIITKF